MFKEYVEALYEAYKKGLVEIPCDDTEELKKELFVALIEDALNEVTAKIFKKIFKDQRDGVLNTMV
jgi:hypothetical protein